MNSPIFEYVKSIWLLRILSFDTITIHLGNFILGILVLVAGSLLVKYFTRKRTQQLFQKWIKKERRRVWLENSVHVLLIVATFFISLRIIGVPLSSFGLVWHLRLFNLGDHAIQVGNIVLGLILLYPGIRLSRYISHRFRAVFLGRLRLDLATESSMEAVFRYVLVLFVILFVFAIIGIPLTAFTLVGGALAIGVGLGSQNLVNNFLSGLVLMMERPLKIGDMVEIEKQKGTVEHIGGRATRIRTLDNVRMVLPNSSLLEKTVINWSLIDNYLRREIIVGVAYGSPTKQVSSLIQQAAKEHSDVESSPAPIVLFRDFGDNALVFRLLFWIKLREAIRPFVVESEIRFRIDELLRDADITIAFPQRDVHLDSKAPVEVKIVSDSESRDHPGE